jgi:MFS family permease
MGFTHDIPGLLVTAAVVTFSTGVLRPASTSLITQLTSRGEQGSVLGLTQSLQSVAAIIAPLFSGLLIDHRRLEIWALTGALACAVAFVFSRPAQIVDTPRSGPIAHR